MTDHTPEEDIRAPLALLFVIACILILFGSIGEILIFLMKWAGYLIATFVAATFAWRFAYGVWPEWAIKPCRKVAEIRGRL